MRDGEITPDFSRRVGIDVLLFARLGTRQGPTIDGRFKQTVLSEHGRDELKQAVDQQPRLIEQKHKHWRPARRF